MQLYELKRKTRFTFQGDTNRPKDIYWFLKMDGMYGQIFGSKADMEAFKNPAFVSGSSVVEEVKND
jgi:hypothetical protein